MAEAAPLDWSVLSAPFALPRYKARGRGVQVGALRGQCQGARRNGEEKRRPSFQDCTQALAGEGEGRRVFFVFVFWYQGERHCGKR